MALLFVSVGRVWAGREAVVVLGCEHVPCSRRRSLSGKGVGKVRGRPSDECWSEAGDHGHEGTHKVMSGPSAVRIDVANPRDTVELDELRRNKTKGERRTKTDTC